MDQTLVAHLTTAEAARRLRLSKQGLRDLVAKGVIHCINTPLGLLFDPLEVERLRKARQKSA